VAADAHDTAPHDERSPQVQRARRYARAHVAWTHAELPAAERQRLETSTAQGWLDGWWAARQDRAHTDAEGADPATCPHPAARVVAGIGDVGEPDADRRGLTFDVLPDAGPSPLADHQGREVALTSGVRATMSLGVCAACLAPVATVGVADYDNWTVEHGPAWSTRWARLVRDGDAAAIVDPDAARDESLLVEQAAEAAIAAAQAVVGLWRDRIREAAGQRQELPDGAEVADGAALADPRYDAALRVAGALDDAQRLLGEALRTEQPGSDR